MTRYCLVKVETTADGKVSGLFSAKRPSTFIDETVWTPTLNDPGVIWYSSPEEANLHLVTSNECILAFSIEEVEEELEKPRKVKRSGKKQTRKQTTRPGSVARAKCAGVV